MPVQTAAQSWISGETDALEQPFFFQDDHHPLSFFVEPRIAPIARLDTAVIPAPAPERASLAGSPIALIGRGPAADPIPTPDPSALFSVRPRQDWMETTPRMRVRYGNVSIDATGRADRETRGFERWEQIA